MAMVNRQLTKTELDALMRAPPLGLQEHFGLRHSDPWPIMVHYRVGLEDSKPQYTERNAYRCDGDGPSDCCWIVPGTAQRRS